MPYFYDQLLKAQLENSASDLTPASTGLIYFNTATSLISYYNASVWKVVADTTSTQIFTNKDYDGGTASNSSRITLPKADTATLAALTRKEATIAYDTDLDQTVIDNGSGFLPIGSSGSGSGEINVISNPSASVSTTGWTAATNYTVARDISNSPLNPTTSSCFAMSTTTAAAESSTSGVYFPIATMPTGLRSKKLKVEFYCTIPDTADGVWRLSVYDGTTRVALSTDSSSVTTLPGGFTGKFTAFFDTSTNDDYVVNFSQTTRTNANTLYVTGIVVGPGIQPQGSVVTEWQSYTPTTDGLGTPATNTAHWRRVGDSIEVIGFAKAGTPAASPIKFSLPLSYTIDSTKVEGNQKSALGFFNNTAGTNNGIWIANIASVIISDSSDYNSVFVSRQNAAEPTSVTYNSPVNGSSLLSAASCMSYRFVAPVSQFSGSGTLNLAQNDVEYASVAGTWDAASTTTVYGPGGTLMGGTLAAARNKTITWQTPVQNTDRIQVWGSKDQVNWFPINGSQLGASSDTVIPVVNDAGSAVSGVAWRPGATAYETIVIFNQYMNQAADGSPSVDWPNSASYWVATKSKTGQAVGFGLADTSGNSGLVNPYGTSGVVYSGTYTPTLTNTTNIAASTAYTTQYMRVGKMVTVAGSVDIDPTAAAPTTTVLKISLPISSNLSAAEDANGTSVGNIATTGVKVAGVIDGDTTNDVVQLTFNATDTSNQKHKFTFMYEIK